MGNIEDELKQTNSEIKVLEERVKNFKEISDRTILTYRNFGIGIITLLTFIGAGSIYTVITSIVKDTAQKGIIKTLNEDFIKTEIDRRSKDAIDELTKKVKKEIVEISNDATKDSKNLINKMIISAQGFVNDLEVKNKNAFVSLETKVENMIFQKSAKPFEKLKKEITDIIEENRNSIIELVNRKTKELEGKYEDVIKEHIEYYSTYQDWDNRASEATKNQNYKEALTFYKKALKKFDTLSIRSKGIMYLNLIEAYLFNREYEKASRTIDDLIELRGSDNNSTTVAIAFFYKCVTQKILVDDDSDAESKLESFFSRSQKSLNWWGFDNLKKWVQNIGIEGNDKEKEKFKSYMDGKFNQIEEYEESI